MKPGGQSTRLLKSPKTAAGKEGSIPTWENEKVVVFGFDFAF
jgi:hypothetical protein